MALNNEEIPDKCKLKIAKSTPEVEWYNSLLRGGYTVHPVPTPVSINNEVTNKNKEGGNNQKLKLLSLGNAISGAPINNGKKKLPKPPIKIGMTTKKTINKPCAVTITLYN